MSEPWDQPSFEQLLNDDSPVFDEESWLTDAIDWDAQYPPAPEEPIQDHQDPARLAEKQSPMRRTDVSILDAAPMLPSPQFPDAPLPWQSFHSMAKHSGLGLPEDEPVKQKTFVCEEPHCRARYVRKGDLARHRREEHSDEEYLCPYSRCLWNRKGHGFKRMHRLASHLIKPGKTPYTHPQALSRLDARYIAVDFNDSLITQNMLWVPKETRDSSEEEAVVLNGHEPRYGELAKYVNRLKGVYCPQTGCGAFLVGDSEDGVFDLRIHLHDEHKIGWAENKALAQKAIAAQKDTA